jgi:hypothetical protein
MKYVLYEGQNGDMLFTKEQEVQANPHILEPFTNKTPTFTVEAENDGDAVAQLNAHIMLRVQNK